VPRKAKRHGQPPPASSHRGKRKEDRPNAAQRGYCSERWKRLRVMVLARDPVCVVCGRNAATDADHIIPKREGGIDALENLQGLCGTCHRRKTGRGR
jgi:5-methylcytosine-specific restriction protein A